LNITIKYSETEKSLVELTVLVIKTLEIL